MNLLIRILIKYLFFLNTLVTIFGQNNHTLSIKNVKVSTYVSVQAGDGLAIDIDGNLYAANYGTDIVYKIAKNKLISTFLEKQDGACGMIVGADNSLFLSRYESADIIKITDKGNTIEPYADNIPGPISLVFDSKGSLYTNNNYNHLVTKINSSGIKSSFAISVLNNSSIAIDNDDNLYISDYKSGNIIKVDSKTKKESLFSTLPIKTGGVGFIIFSDGFFYATAIKDNVIFMIDKNGKAKIIAGIQGKAGSANGNGNLATFNQPNGIVASKDGRSLYVAQQKGNSSIRLITGFRKN